jgi:hypothetical protein
MPWQVCSTNACFEIALAPSIQIFIHQPQPERDEPREVPLLIYVQTRRKEMSIKVSG